MAWRKMQIKEFLTPRKERYKADDPAISDMPRIEKIDFTGEIFISDKPSKTGMIAPCVRVVVTWGAAWIAIWN